MINSLTDNYGIAINGYEQAFTKSGGSKADSIFNKVFKRSKVNN